MKKSLNLLIAVILVVLLSAPSLAAEEAAETDNLVLRSAVRVPAGWLFSIENTETETRSWVRQNESIADFRIIDFDTEKEELILEKDGERLSLPLEAAGARPQTREGSRPEAGGQSWEERRASWRERRMDPDAEPQHTPPPQPIDTMSWTDLEAYRAVLAEENRMLVVTRQADGSPAYVVTRRPRPWDELPEGAQRRMSQETYEERIQERMQRMEEMIRSVHPAAPRDSENQRPELTTERGREGPGK